MYAEGKYALNCFIRANVSTHLELSNFVIAVCYPKYSHIAAFVTFADVFYGFNGVAIFDVDVSVERFRQYKGIRDYPSVIDLYFLVEQRFVIALPLSM